MRRVIEKLRKTSVKVSLNIFVNSLIQLHTTCGLCTSNLTNRRILKKRWFSCINTSRFLFFLNKKYLFVYVCVYCTHRVLVPSSCVFFLMIMLHEMHLVGSGSMNYMGFQNVTLCNPLFICFLHFTSF